MFSEFRDRLLRIKLQRDEKMVSFLFSIEGIVIILLVANIIFLNLYILHNLSAAKSTANTTAPSPTAAVSSNSPLSSSPTILPTTCPNCLNQTLSPTVLPVNTSSQPVVNPVKDYFIPLGSGTNQTSDWTDIPGVQAIVDFGQYQNIKEIHLEASIYVPTANETVSVRLYNQSDNHPVWYSEMTTDGSASDYLTSPAIIYDTGSKLYQVQMKTQLQYPANLVQSRIHVVLK